MTEMDAFERRVAETLRWHADDVTPVVDGRDVARRVALEHPRRRKGALPWCSVAIPRLGTPVRPAWLLLLLAGLLTAMVGGILVTGSQTVNEKAVVPPIGRIFECPAGSTPDEPGPVDQARPPVDALPAMAFDRKAGRLVALVGVDEGTETWTFDVCTNSWTKMHPDRRPPESAYWGRLVYDADSNVTITVLAGSVFVYDLSADDWTEKDGMAPPDAQLWAYDPITGHVFAADRSDPPALWEYDVATDTWTPIDQANGPTQDAVFAYDTSIDRMVAYTRGETSGAETWLFDIRTGTWTKSGAGTPVLMVPMHLTHLIDFDEAAKRTVIMGGGDLAAYDAAAEHWEILVGHPERGPRPDGPMFLWHTAYDPVNERLVGQGQADDVLAFDTQTHEWTTLLEPSDG